jgi:quinolinate synthase
MHSFTPDEMKDYQKRIRELKDEQNAVILAHNYQIPAIQDVADLVGDSLGLSREAARIDADVIVFCGVKFMAESAKILSPDRTVLHPDAESICPMAAMIDVETIRHMRTEFPDAVVVAYVNTTADVKAEVDICCTSANAVKTIKHLPEKDIIFIPDVNLGMYVTRFAPEKNIILHPGYCPTHNNITVEMIEAMKIEHPEAEVMVHPESIPDVIDLADGVFSTEGMIRYSLESKAREFIVVTEREMTYRLATDARKAGLDKVYHPIPTAICPNMKKITTDKLLRCLETGGPEITLPRDIIERARKPLDRMLEIGR